MIPSNLLYLKIDGRHRLFFGANIYKIDAFMAATFAAVAVGETQRH